MTYQVRLNIHENETHEIEADNFIHDKGGLIFYKGETEEKVPIAIGFFPVGDVEFVKEKK